MIILTTHWRGKRSRNCTMLMKRIKYRSSPECTRSLNANFTHMRICLSWRSRSFLKEKFTRISRCLSHLLTQMRKAITNWTVRNRSSQNFPCTLSLKEKGIRRWNCIKESLSISISFYQEQCKWPITMVSSTAIGNRERFKINLKGPENDHFVGSKS